MEKIIKISICLLLLTTLCACNSAEEKQSIDEEVKSVEPVQKILQDRVIEVTYETIDEDTAIDYMSKYDIFELGGCSAIKTILNDKVYVGRNYDFYCSNSPAFIVRNNSGTYRTIGIGNTPFSLSDWTENYVIEGAVLNALPYSCCDVMNEAGIYAETNIRYSEDGLECKQTNPGKTRVCTQMFMQMMLSKYGSIEEILAHIDDYDWYDLTKLGFCQSFMLVDKTGYSVVVEFAADSWKATECSYNANFFIDNEYYEKAKWPEGEMRISRELAYLPYVRSAEDIFTMMSKGSYTQFYSSATDLEYTLGEWYVDLGYDRFTLEEHKEEALEQLKAELESYDNYTWEQHVEEWDWETSFCVVANVTDLNLDVHYSEHFGIDFNISFETSN